MTHEFGCKQEEVEWWMERTPEHSHAGASGFKTPKGTTIKQIPPEKSIGSMLLSGELHATSLYFEDQRPEAKRRSADFIDTRIPKFFDWFENILARPEPKDYLLGDTVTYADLSLFQLVAGLRYAFPKALARIDAGYPLLTALHDRVAARPRIAAYLKSARRIPFNEEGIFRHYKELDK